MCLPDKRLDKVLSTLLGRVVAKQKTCLRQLADCRGEEVSFGRFFLNERVMMEDLCQQLYDQAARHIREAGPGHVLLIEDTTQVGFHLGRQITGAGKVDKGQVQGFYLHPVLCLDAGHYGCYGIPYLHVAERPWTESPLSRGQRKSLGNRAFFEDKEGHRWLSSAMGALPACGQVATKTVVADREADIYPLLAGLRAQGLHYVVRARIDRPLRGGGKLFAACQGWPAMQYLSVQVPAKGGKPARQATLAIKYGHVELRGSGARTRGKLQPWLGTYVVVATEQGCPAGQEPVHWVLLTSHTVENAQQALQVVEWYRQRWNVEQLFRTLKGRGLCPEQIQPRHQQGILKMAVVALMGCVRVIQLLQARENATGQKISCCFGQGQQYFIGLLTAKLEGPTEKLANPHPAHTLAYATWTIARLGGWKGYQSQRPPGPIDIHTGLKKFEQLYLGFCMAHDMQPEQDVYIL